MAKSLQDIPKHRQQEEFVGREEQLAFFRRNLRYEPEDDCRRFVINISGQGGVGKTWLLRQPGGPSAEFILSEVEGLRTDVGAASAKKKTPIISSWRE